MKVTKKFNMRHYPDRLTMVRFITFLQRLKIINNLQRLTIARKVAPQNTLGILEVATWEEQQMEIELTFKD